MQKTPIPDTSLHDGAATSGPVFIGRSFFGVALLLTLVLAWWAYAPGLSGEFLFDDYNNLDQLGAYGRVDNLRSLLLYLTSGSADPTGRPLSLLTFLLDARDWPADPEPFKRSNILLHLLNGALLGLTLLRLSPRLRLPPPRARAAALLGAALWTLHPLLVSTTLYIVQREAMLPATFSLLGMLCWLKGTEIFAASRRRALLWLVGGAWGCTALAVLCKANGLLLPLLLLCLEWALPSSFTAEALDAERRFRRTRTILLALPSALIALWLLARLPAVFSGESFGRPWTLGQRLLSEGRVVWDYLQALWIPRATASSVFNDGFTASTGWLTPWTTLPALLALLLLLGLGIRLRRSHPALAFAILFYFAGQLLESTVIPLELYFEHRNYLPALPMFWPLALWFTAPGALRRLRGTCAVLLPLLLALLCHARAGVWGRPYEQALLLAQVDPDSPRAQANAAAYEIANQRPDLAAARLAEADRRMPDQVQITLNWVAADCKLGAAGTPALEAAHRALARDRGGIVMVQSWLGSAIDSAGQDRCAGLDLAELERMLGIVRGNPGYMTGPADTSKLLQLEGQLALARKDGPAALRAFDQALAEFPTPDGALLQAAMLGSAGFAALGLDHLRRYHALEVPRSNAHGMPAIHLWLLQRQGYWAGEFTHLEQQLRQDAAGGG